MKFIARVVTGRPLVSLLVFLGLVGFSAIWGMQAFGNLQAAGYNDPSSESTQVYNELQSTFGVDNPEMVIIADFAEPVDTAATKADAAALTESIRNISGVNKVTSYFSLGQPASLKSTDSNAAYFFVNYDPSVKVSAETTLIENTLGSEHDGAKVYYTGISAMANALTGTITKAQIREIAEKKLPDLNANDIEAAAHVFGIRGWNYFKRVILPGVLTEKTGKPDAECRSGSFAPLSIKRQLRSYCSARVMVPYVTAYPRAPISPEGIW